MKAGASVILGAALAAACGSSGAGSPSTPSVTPPPDLTPLARSLHVANLAVYQAVKVSVMRGQAKVAPNAPVVAGRPALVRADVVPTETWTPRALVGELHLWERGMEVAILRDTKAVAGASVDSDLATTFNFDVDGALLTTAVQYALVIRDPAMPAERAESRVRYPADGSYEPFDARPTGGDLKISLVPVRYDPGGGAAPLLPDVTDAQVKLYEETVFKLYPTSKVALTVREALPWTAPIAADGTGWDALMAAVGSLRTSDGASDDTFYVGAFVSTPTEQQYCANSNGCVRGAAPLADVFDVAARMALIAGYAGHASASALAHELGHALGRQHTECGGGGNPDPKFPYPEGRLGVWGYDLSTKTLIDPGGSARDLMGYCDPAWISDYTYAALFTRLSYINGTSTH